MKSIFIGNDWFGRGVLFVLEGIYLGGLFGTIDLFFKIWVQAVALNFSSKI